MKKRISVALATCIACSTLAFTACGEGELSGKIKGNYKVITTTAMQRQFEKDLDDLDDQRRENGGTMLGDMESVKFSYGISFKTDILVNYYFEGVSNGTIDIDGDIGFRVFNKKKAPQIEGAGDIDATIKFKDKKDGAPDEVTDTRLQVATYLTDGWLYGDMTMTGRLTNEPIPEENQHKKAKETLTEFCNDFNLNFDGLQMEEFDVFDIVLQMEEWGFKRAYEYNEKSGMKMRFSAPDEWFEGLVTMLNLDSYAIEKQQSTLDFYVSVNAKGILQQVSADVNIDWKIPSENNSLPSYLTAEGAVVFKASPNVKISIPDGLAEDEEYK